MRIIAFIEDPKVIDKIIRHLKLTFRAERQPPPQVLQQELLMAAEERGEYFLGIRGLSSVDLSGGVYLLASPCAVFYGLTSFFGH